MFGDINLGMGTAYLHIYTKSDKIACFEFEYDPPQISTTIVVFYSFYDGHVNIQMSLTHAVG